jgi:hypothetical protein
MTTIMTSIIVYVTGVIALAGLAVIMILWQDIFKKACRYLNDAFKETIDAIKDDWDDYRGVHVRIVRADGSVERC